MISLDLTQNNIKLVVDFFGIKFQFSVLYLNLNVTTCDFGIILIMFVFGEH